MHGEQVVSAVLAQDCAINCPTTHALQFLQLSVPAVLENVLGAHAKHCRSVVDEGANFVSSPTLHTVMLVQTGGTLDEPLHTPSKNSPDAHSPAVTHGAQMLSIRPLQPERRYSPAGQTLQGLQAASAVGVQLVLRKCPVEHDCVHGAQRSLPAPGLKYPAVQLSHTVSDVAVGSWTA